MSRSTFMHGLEKCRSCGLPLEASKDVDELIREGTDPTVKGAWITHRRCGWTFQAYFLFDRERTAHRLRLCTAIAPPRLEHCGADFGMSRRVPLAHVVGAHRSPARGRPWSRR
jgi:hypothetical protein